MSLQVTGAGGPEIRAVIVVTVMVGVAGGIRVIVPLEPQTEGVTHETRLNAPPTVGWMRRDLNWSLGSDKPNKIID